MEYIWFGIILVSFLAYVVLDGYDLGAGTLTLFQRNRHTRHEMLEEVGNVWDGNETWLVMVGVSLWAGFPLAFGVLLPHLYLPLIVMLFGLIVRGFSIELISQRDGKVGEGWYRAFGIGSLVAAFAQGFALGSLSTAVSYEGTSYSGGAFDAFSWFSVLTGVGVVVLYVTLGYAYLFLRGTGDRGALWRQGRRGVLATGVLAVVALALVGLTPAGIYFSTPVRSFGFAGVMLFAVGGLAIAYIAFREKPTHDQALRPLLGMSLATVAVVVAFLITHAPDIVPGLTIQEAAAPSSTYDFLLVGIGLNIPLLAYYTWFAQRTLGRRRTAAVLGKEA